MAMVAVAAITATSTAEHVEAGTGLRAESSAEMALVSLVASDGARAIPAFADNNALSRLLQQKGVVVNAQPLDKGGPWWEMPPCRVRPPELRALGTRPA